MSGQHVVYGFLRPYLRATRPDHELTIVHYESMSPPDDVLAMGIETIAVPDKVKGWMQRTIWESTKLAKIVREQSADVVLNVSGALLPRCPVPQVVLCQNPWCYIPAAHRNWKESFKAKMQRIGYASAFRKSAKTLYISEHLRDLYRSDNPGLPEADSDIANVGLNADTFETAKAMAGQPRQPLSILSVSAMASWKGAHTLVDAVALLHKRGVDAKLNLVGPWPHNEYEDQVRNQIAELGLAASVQILGRVSDEELHRQYATNQVFCLMSCCESFGIPAAEAMCFGTPVVSTNVCAISEICAGTGLFGPANNPTWTADALQQVLTDEDKWATWSTTARTRAANLTWENCSKPLLEIPNLAGK